MRATKKHRARWEPVAYDRRPPQYLRRVFDWLDPFELVIVRRHAMLRSCPIISSLAAGINILGDGWLYPALAILVFAIFGTDALNPMSRAALSVMIAHLIYPWLKFHMARPRPMAKDQTLFSARQPIDRYSCPSGHAMTATAAFLPLGFAYSGLGAFLLIIWMML